MSPDPNHPFLYTKKCSKNIIKSVIKNFQGVKMCSNCGAVSAADLVESNRGTDVMITAHYNGLPPARLAMDCAPSGVIRFDGSVGPEGVGVASAMLDASKARRRNGHIFGQVDKSGQ